MPENNNPTDEPDIGARNLQVAATLSNLVPLVGGAIGSILSGASNDRKFTRVHEVLIDFNNRLEGFESEESQQYVNTEDFQELFEHTFQQVAKERSEEKRKIYGAFLADNVMHPGKPYNEELHFISLLEELQFDHIRILQACMQEPESTQSYGISSHGQTLSRRLPDIPSEQLHELVTQLNDKRITDIPGMGGMMTAHGAEEMRGTVKPLGQRFVQYLTD